MTWKDSINPPTREHQIEQVIRTILEGYRGQAINCESIEREHPNLMPELGEKLRWVVAVGEARRSARKPTRSSSADSDGGQIFHEAEAFLGEVLPAYEILEQIHYGGQGVVYKAIQRSTKRPVAIKLLLDGPLATARQRERFSREVELVARLRHPNIVTVYESGVVRGRDFVAMEFIDGMPIDDYVLFHGCGVRMIVEKFRIVCGAVSAAHQRGIIHRDLKPANVLVDSRGQPHVLDFGLAKELMDKDMDEADRRLSLTGQVVGTLPYLSPEQARGAVDEVDVRSDIYSLGVVLFELLTGEFPYRVDGSTASVLSHIVSTPPARLRTVPSRRSNGKPTSAAELNNDLERVVLKALCKEPEERYQSASAFAEDLGRYLAGDAVEAHSRSGLYLLRKTLRRYRVHVSIGIAFAFLVFGGLVGMTILWHRADAAARIAQAGLQMASNLKLGSVERDAGRIRQAALLLEQALEAAKYADQTDPFIQRQQFDAHHRLSELYLDTDRLTESRGHADAASQVAQLLHEGDRENLEWLRLKGFALRLRARLAINQEEWASAMEYLNETASIRLAILQKEPDNTSLKLELASIYAMMGDCLRQQKEYDDAYARYKAASEIYEGLAAVEKSPGTMAIEISRLEGRLGVLCMSYKTPLKNEEAAIWFAQATNRLESLSSSVTNERARDIASLHESIQDNEEILRKRKKTD